MKHMLAMLGAAVLLGGLATPAYANHERSRCGGGYDSDSYGCDDYGGQGNRNRQDRHQGRDDNHKAFSPDLKDSPTTIYLCLPGSTCNFGEPKDKDDQGGDEGQKPNFSPFVATADEHHHRHHRDSDDPEAKNHRDPEHRCHHQPERPECQTTSSDTTTTTRERHCDPKS